MALESNKLPESGTDTPSTHVDATSEIGRQTASALYENLLAKGGELTGLRNSWLFAANNPEEATSRDVDATWNILQHRLPIEGNEWRRGSYQHLIDTASYAARIAQQMRPSQAVLKPHAFAMMGILRNSGQLLHPQSEYYRKSILSRIICERLDIPQAMVAALLSPQHFRGIGNTATDEEMAKHIATIESELTADQKILEFSGLLAKRRPDRTLVPFAEIIEQHHEATRRSQETLAQITPAKQLFWRSSNAVTGAISPNFSKGYSGIYVRIAGMLESHGVDLGAIQSSIVNDEQHQPLNPDAPEDQLALSKKALMTFLRSQE